MKEHIETLLQNDLSLVPSRQSAVDVFVPNKPLGGDPVHG
jgi:hypothetical protein